MSTLGATGQPPTPLEWPLLYFPSRLLEHSQCRALTISRKWPLHCWVSTCWKVFLMLNISLELQVLPPGASPSINVLPANRRGRHIPEDISQGCGYSFGLQANHSSLFHHSSGEMAPTCLSWMAVSLAMLKIFYPQLYLTFFLLQKRQLMFHSW